jgi:myo-inositol-1(or 4)-monophosphatase
MDPAEIQGFRAATEQISVEAGKLIMRLSQDARSIEFKGQRDMVTSVDSSAEALIVQAIQERYPRHQILAEEGGGKGKSKSDFRWIIDPLDGTTNFVHGFPVFCVSIALEYQGRIVAGAIYDPNRSELFSAGLNLGATLNGLALQVSQTAAIGSSLIATGFPYTNNAHFDLNMKAWVGLYGQTQGLRRAGAAAIDLAWVACGRLDAYWEFCIKPWDMAAGLLLVREAGGKISDPYGGPLDFSEGHILASNGHLHHELVTQLTHFAAPNA